MGIFQTVVVGLPEDLGTWILTVDYSW
jgi:hypothetical protein